MRQPLFEFDSIKCLLDNQTDGLRIAVVGLNVQEIDAFGNTAKVKLFDVQAFDRNHIGRTDEVSDEVKYAYAVTICRCSVEVHRHFSIGRIREGCQHCTHLRLSLAASQTDGYAL
jgi:hypothetical protein